MPNIVPTLPAVLPSRNGQEPEVFVDAMDNFIASLPAFAAAADAVAQAFNLNAVQSESTSTATLTTGLKTFSVPAGKSWLRGMDLKIASSENPTTVWLNCVVDSYSGTSLVVNVLQFFGTAGASVTGWTIMLTAPPQIEYENSVLLLTGGSGMATTDNKIRRFTTIATNTAGDDLSYADNAANGGRITVLRQGWYFIRYRDAVTTGLVPGGISLNSSQLTTVFGSINVADRILELKADLSGSSLQASGSTLAFLAENDVLRAHMEATSSLSTTANVRLEIRRVSLKGMGGSGGGGGGGGGAPTDAGYIVTALNGGLSNERVLTGTATVTVDNGTANQTKIARAAIIGDISIPLDSNVATIPANTIANNMFENMPAYSIKMNNSNLAATPTDFVVPVSCLIGRDATGAIIAIPLGANMSLVGGALTSSGGGGGGGAPVGAQYIVAAADGTLTAERLATSGTSIIVDIGTTGQIKFKRAALTGDATASEDSNSLTIPNNTVGNAKAADIPANSVKCNNTAALADPVDLNIPASSLFGRADTGNLAAIPLGPNFVFDAGTLKLTGVPLWDGTKFTDLAGSQITFGNGVYTWAGKPAANSLPVYSRITINPSSFAGTHKHTIGPTVVTDLTNWMPDGAQLLARASGSVATPLGTASGTSATAFNIAAHFQLPAGFFEYAGGGLRIMFKARKTGADANPSTFGVQIGKFNSASNTSIATFVTSAAAGRDVVVEENMRILATGVGNTASFISGLVPRNTGNTAAVLTDKTSTAFDTTVAMYVVFTAHCPLNAAATHELTEYEIWWIP